MKKHYVTFESPGTFVHETTTREIDSWDTAKAVEMARGITERHASKPFAFYFTTRERGDKDFEPKQVKESGRYFLGGRVLTLKEVEREMPQERILIANMKNNDMPKIVINTNSWKICQPLGKNDKVLDVKI